MQAIILNNIKFDLKEDSFETKWISSSEAPNPTLVDLFKTARAIAKPRAAFLVCTIQDRGKDYVVIDNFRIQSRVLRVNFDQVQRVFPFIATCGNEIEDWANSQFDVEARLWAQRICEIALETIIKALAEHIETRFQTGPTSKVNPGSTIDWPLEGQRELFELLGDASERIGVSLSKNLWMTPAFSTSGIRYPSQKSFENCSLCPMEDCRLRKAPYQATLYEHKYLAE